MNVRKLRADAIRVLAIDAIEKANSGHPGMPMGMADIAEVLWNDHLVHNPSNPDWANRDRFVLSNGHGSMLLYAVLHLSGYDLFMDDIMAFRQLHSKTPGHPEYGDTPGVETTTGPLGQGIANGVGMAIAEQILAKRYNRDDFNIIDHFTYVFTGDGCLMEGISHEACSLAGTLGVGKLIMFYDQNGISIDGKIDNWFDEDVPQRFKAYGWQVLEVDGHNSVSINRAIVQAKLDTQRPTLVCCRTQIGFGSPNKVGTAASHGAPLGAEEIAATREQLGWELKPFEISDDIYRAWNARDRGLSQEQQWLVKYDDYSAQYSKLANELERLLEGRLPLDWHDQAFQMILSFAESEKPEATRKSSGRLLESLGKVLPEMIGGSADLTGSNNTNWSGSVAVGKENPDGNYIYYGVREFAMAAITNGISLHGGLIPYSGTFLTFSDYSRNAIRMAALMSLRNIFVLTHDSIGLGEDGPTHQPVEHMSTLRLIPNNMVWRPCDATETAIAWQCAIINKEGPTCLLLTRQNLVQQERDEEQLATVELGGYILAESNENPEVILLATGSEVEIAMQAFKQLVSQKVKTRVVSMPCVELFEQQTEEYRNMVLPSSVRARVAIEAGRSNYWYKFTGLDGEVIGLDSYGASAPAEKLYEHFGLTAQQVVIAALKTINKNSVAA